ncbi:MAG: MarR family transcriptional regulator [Sphingosinicella sp.]|nr:MarR family transcriptional regulator [Sphingosinicella sp.]
MVRALEFLGDSRPAFVAHLAERLTEALCRSTQMLADENQLKAPIRTHSILLYLMDGGPASLAEIARSDGQSHQLVASRLKPLEELGLIERQVDPKDARRRPYQLSRSGRTEAQAIRGAIGAHARAMEALFAETGVDLVKALDEALEALRLRPLAERIAEVQPDARAAA